jgi:hypothetical protein
MGYVYSNPERADDATSLPDVEVFYAHAGDLVPGSTDEPPSEEGWYWWNCFPGCMPDSEPHGPFPKLKDAMADIRESLDE